jgi:hypothetical protein
MSMKVFGFNGRILTQTRNDAEKILASGVFVSASSRKAGRWPDLSGRRLDVIPEAVEVFAPGILFHQP